LVESDGGDCIGALQYGFHVAETIPEVAAISLESGMDMDLGGTTFLTLAHSVANNLTSVAALDRAVYNVLASKFAAGLFEHPYTDEARVKNLDGPYNRRLAREVAEQSMVLLKNPDNFLPLHFASTDDAAAAAGAVLGDAGAGTSSMKSIALIGPLVNDEVNQCGSYTNAGANVVTFQDAFEQFSKEKGLSLTVSRGANTDDRNHSMIKAAVDAASKADVAIVIVGDSTNTCGEMYDRASIELPGAQLQLLEALVEQKTPVVAILVNGRPTTFGGYGSNQPPCAATSSSTGDCGAGNVLDKLAAFMVAWRPAEEGGYALINLLSGAANPSGRLTSAWPRSTGGIGGPGSPYLYPYQGNHQGEKYSGGDGYSTALFGFGEGLSYTVFDLTDLEVSPKMAHPNATFTVTLVATNNGVMDGGCVVQLYFRDPYALPIRIASVQLVS
jgi:beta-glucosidase